MIAAFSVVSDYPLAGVTHPVTHNDEPPDIVEITPVTPAERRATGPLLGDTIRLRDGGKIRAVEAFRQAYPTAAVTDISARELALGQLTVEFERCIDRLNQLGVMRERISAKLGIVASLDPNRHGDAGRYQKLVRESATIDRQIAEGRALEQILGKQHRALADLKDLDAPWSLVKTVRALRLDLLTYASSVKLPAFTIF